MKYLLSFCIVVSGFFVGCKSKPSKEKTIGPENGNDSINTAADTLGNSIMNKYNKSDIKRMLQKLALTPAPETMEYGAMCYDMAMPPPNASFVCPDCGEKTLYSEDQAQIVRPEDQAQIVRLIQDNEGNLQAYSLGIEQINLKIDASQFCKKCHPEIENPSYCLMTNIPGSSDTTKVCNIEEEDMVILKEFLNGDLKHKDFYDAETPLKNYIERIQELLGVTIK